MKRTRPMNILDALGDPKVFGHAFRGDTWRAWRVFLKALFALPMSDDELAIYKQHTGRTAPPSAPNNEAWLVIGRRGGKSFALARLRCSLLVSGTGGPASGRARSARSWSCAPIGARPA